VVVWVLYNFYSKRSFTRPETHYIRNMRFIQMLMGLSADSMEQAFQCIDDYFYWRVPEKTVFLLKVLLQSTLGIFLTLYVLPLRHLAVLGLWGGVFSQSPFFIAIFTVLRQKVPFNISNIGLRVFLACKVDPVLKEHSES